MEQTTTWFDKEAVAVTVETPFLLAVYLVEGEWSGRMGRGEGEVRQ